MICVERGIYVRIAICDDENSWINVLESYLTKLKSEITDMYWDAFSSGEELLDYSFKHNIRYDIVIIDIELDGLSGIETANQIRTKDSNAIIIFLTSHTKYMRSCFKCKASAFWEKPIEYKEFKADIKNAIKDVKTNAELFVFKYNKTDYSIPFDEIMYFNKELRKIIVHTKYKEYELLGTFKEYKEQFLKHNFVFVHNSFCVNMLYIRKKSKLTVTMADGIEIPVSNTFRTAFENRYLNFITKESKV